MEGMESGGGMGGCRRRLRRDYVMGGYFQWKRLEPNRHPLIRNGEVNNTERLGKA
jgi:hypothetical protein